MFHADRFPNTACIQFPSTIPKYKSACDESLFEKQPSTRLDRLLQQRFLTYFQISKLTDLTRLQTTAQRHHDIDYYRETE